MHSTVRICAKISSIAHVQHNYFSSLERFSIEYRKTKKLLRQSTVGANSAINQSKFVAIPGELLKAREKSRVQVAISLGFSSHWLII